MGTQIYIYNEISIFVKSDREFMGHSSALVTAPSSSYGINTEHSRDLRRMLLGSQYPLRIHIGTEVQHSEDKRKHK